jgi:hypothetical protein
MTPMNKTFANVIVIVLAVMLGLGLLIHTINAGNHRPEGVAEHWLKAISDTGRAGIHDDAVRRAEKLGPVGLAAPLVPVDHDNRRANFTDLEVGKAVRTAGIARVPYHLHENVRRGSPPTRQGTIVMARAGDSWRVTELTPRGPGERVPSEGGSPPSSAPVSLWVGAIVLGVLLAAGSHALVRYADRTARTAMASAGG